MIVTIDGPAGAGKSSAARSLASRLGFEFLDTGAMYRAVALLAIRARIDLEDASALAGLVNKLHLEMPPGRVVANGEDVTASLRTAAITAATGPVADSPPVRRRLVEFQRTIADGRNMVCEGRDQGTVVFPMAECKFFLVADPVERARRRQRDMAARGEIVPLDDVLRAQQERDERDAHRDLAPMVPAADAVVVDSTFVSLVQLVDHLEEVVRRRLRGEA